jgi:hypothetical protein
MFKSLYAWMVVYNSTRFSSFTEIFDCVFFFALIGVSLTSYILELHPSVLYNEIEIVLLIKKKKKVEKYIGRFCLPISTF